MKRPALLSVAVIVPEFIMVFAGPLAYAALFLSNTTVLLVEVIVPELVKVASEHSLHQIAFCAAALIVPSLYIFKLVEPSRYKAYLSPPSIVAPS